MAKIISYTIFILLFVTGCSTDETEYFQKIMYWSKSKRHRPMGGVQRIISTPGITQRKQPTERGRRTEYKNTYASRYERNCKSGINTRWANMEDNITFRVIAYKCADAANISTANYAGYGDYRLSGSSVQTNKKLSLLIGTYTFCLLFFW